MPRIMTIWLPRWPAQRRIGENPALRAVPVFVCRRGRGGTMTIVSWAWAQPPRRAPALAGGRSPPRIPPGMSLAEGMAVLALAHGSRACRAAEVVHDDPEADRGALEELARRCRRFAPIVGLEEAERPECVHVDVTGTASFFGGDEPLARTAVWMLAARGLHGRAAVADTAGAAWAAAHQAEQLDRQPTAPWRRRRRFAVVPPGRQAAALAALPAGALRIEEGPVAVLREVGIDSIGGVLKLPRGSLAARFPPVLALRLAQFLGTRAEPIVPASGEMPPQAAHAFDAPMSLRDMDEAQLGGILERLVERCVAPLAARGEGVTSLQVRFESRMARGDGHAPRPPLVIDVGLYRPTVSVRHVVDLVRLRMSRMRPPHEVEDIVAEVVAASPTVCRQRTLFSGPSESIVAEVGMLFDRLAGRLGSGAVFEPRMVRDAQPEHAWAPVPPAVPHERVPPSPVRAPARRDPAGRRPPAPPIVPAAPAERRPIWLLPRPLPLEVLAMVPAVADAGRPPARFRYGGECHDVAEAYGPERIETAWWRGPTVRRDYYVVETASGGRFWLFRRLREGDWFLHGLFG